MRARLMMLWWLDPLKKRRLATLAGAFAVVVWGVNWIAAAELYRGPCQASA